MACRYLEIEGQSCLSRSADQGLMKKRQIDLLDGMTKRSAKKIIILVICLPERRYPECFSQ